MASNSGSCFCCGTHRCWLLFIVICGIILKSLDLAIFILNLACPAFFNDPMGSCTAESRANLSGTEIASGVIGILMTVFVIFILFLPICAERHNKPSLLSCFRTILFCFLVVKVVMEIAAMIFDSTNIVYKIVSFIISTMFLLLVIMLSKTRYEELREEGYESC